MTGSSPSRPVLAREMQFRLRTLFVATVIVAMFLVCLTYYVRDWEPRFRWQLFSWLGIYLLIMLATYCWHIRSRARVLSRAGPCWFVSRRALWVETAIIAASIFVACLGLSATFLFIEIGRRNLDMTPIPYMVMALLLWSGAVFVALESRIYNPRLCEKGMLVSSTLTPWEEIKSWQWNKNNQAVLTTKLCKERVTVAPADRLWLAEQLDSYIPSSRQASETGVESSAGSSLH